MSRGVRLRSRRGSPLLLGAVILLLHLGGATSWGLLSSPLDLLYAQATPPPGSAVTEGSFKYGASAEQWRSRSVYQLLTDRFSTDSGVGGWCNLDDYCGGTFRGIINRLDYIAGMGFDAIWIGSVVENAPKGYHGFWPTNLYNINPEFQGAEDLKELVRECHARGMLVAVDVVANHMGGPTAEDLSAFVPFNDTRHYHPCYEDCCNDCKICNLATQHCRAVDQFSLEHCQIAPSLRDLKQEDAEVEGALVAWVQWLLREFQFDGLRFDAAKHVGKRFWRNLKEATGGAFRVAEVYSEQACYVAQYQNEGLMDSMLSYPLTLAASWVFQTGGSMKVLSRVRKEVGQEFSDSTVLWNFLDNHLMPRFLSKQPNQALLKGALVWLLTGEGIPVLYYGTEQGYCGALDPSNREPLWWSGFNTEAELYKFIAFVNHVRKKHSLWEGDLVEVLVQNELYAFTKGQALVLVTNEGGIVNYRLSLPRKWGGVHLCNVFFTPPTDCFFVPKGGELFDVFMVGGNPKIYVPHPGGWAVEKRGGRLRKLPV